MKTWINVMSLIFTIICICVCLFLNLVVRFKVLVHDSRCIFSMNNLPVLIRGGVQEEVEDAAGSAPEGKAAGEGEAWERRRPLELPALEIFSHLVLLEPVHWRQGGGHQRLGSGPAAVPAPAAWPGGLQYDHGNTQRRRRELRFVAEDVRLRQRDA